MNLPKAIICELDGTLCDDRHRLHLVEQPIEWIHTGKDNHLYGYEKNPKYQEEWKPDWESFYAGIPDDGVNDWCLEILKCMVNRFSEKENEGEIIVITGRPERYRIKTQAWIWNECSMQVHDYKLFMRPDFLPIYLFDSKYPELGGTKKFDHRPSHEVKREIYEREISGKYDVLFVLESDEKCAEMYKSLGLQVLRVM